MKTETELEFYKQLWLKYNNEKYFIAKNLTNFDNINEYMNYYENVKDKICLMAQK